MARTVTLEELPADARRVIEEMVASEEPIILSRAGRPVGGLVGYDAPGVDAIRMSPDEIREIQEAVAQGEADYAAGRYRTLDKIKAAFAAQQSRAQ